MEQVKPKRGGPAHTLFKPGQSGNPSGRPRSGLALAEAIRTRIDPDDVVELVCEYMADPDVPRAAKLGVLLPWVHAGYLRPPTTVDVNHSGTAGTTSYEDLPLDEKLRRLRMLREGTDGRPVDADTSPEQNTQQSPSDAPTDDA